MNAQLLTFVSGLGDKRRLAVCLVGDIIFNMLNMIDEQWMQGYEDVVRLLKAIAHPARLAILELLREEEACVCHLEAHLGLRQAYISQQLIVLREAGLVEDRREGWNIFYQISRPEVFGLIEAVEQVSGGAGRWAEGFKPGEGCGCECPKCKPVDEASQV